MKLGISALLGLVVLFAFTDSPFHWSKYEVRRSEELVEFVNSDSIMDEGRKIKLDKEYVESRAEYWMYSSQLIKQYGRDSLDKLLPIAMPCECTLKKDTILIFSGIGYMGGFASIVQIHKGQFSSAFHHYISGEIFKRYLSDSTERESITVENETQQLALYTRPQFRIGERISGILTYSTPTYYRLPKEEEIDTNQVEAKLRFTCILKNSW